MHFQCSKIKREANIGARSKSRKTRSFSWIIALQKIGDFSIMHSHHNPTTDDRFFYHSDKYETDMAVVKLYKPLQLNYDVNLIKLPVDEGYPTGNASFTGWGISHSTGQYPTASLQKAIGVDLIDISSCKQQMIDAGVMPDVVATIGPNNVCTAPGTLQRQACLVSRPWSILAELVGIHLSLDNGKTIQLLF